MGKSFFLKVQLLYLLAQDHGLVLTYQFRANYSTSKRGCMDCMGTISESMEMNRKDFQKKIGLETDEECRIVCPI